MLFSKPKTRSLCSCLSLHTLVFSDHLIWQSESCSWNSSGGRSHYFYVVGRSDNLQPPSIASQLLQVSIFNFLSYISSSTPPQLVYDGNSFYSYSGILIVLNPLNASNILYLPHRRHIWFLIKGRTEIPGASYCRHWFDNSPSQL